MRSAGLDTFEAACKSARGLVMHEQGATERPSAIFFDAEKGRVSYGRDRIKVARRANKKGSGVNTEPWSP
jgi:hypothetical protein